MRDWTEIGTGVFLDLLSFVWLSAWWPNSSMFDDALWTWSSLFNNWRSWTTSHYMKKCWLAFEWALQWYLNKDKGFHFKNIIWTWRLFPAKCRAFWLAKHAGQKASPKLNQWGSCYLTYICVYYAIRHFLFLVQVISYHPTALSHRVRNCRLVPNKVLSRVIYSMIF